MQDQRKNDFYLEGLKIKKPKSEISWKYT